MQQARDRRIFERYQAVYLFLSDYKRSEIAQILNPNVKTVGIYIDTYKGKGLAGLVLCHSTGKAPKLSSGKTILVKTVSTQVPADVGFTACYNWMLALVVEFVSNEWGVSYSPRGMSTVLHHLGLSYTRPTYTLEKADPEKQRKFAEETFPELKKLLNDEFAHILFEDESMIRDYQAIQRTWFLKGKRRIIPTFG